MSKTEVLKESPKKDSKENKEIRSAQSKAGKVKLNERKEFTILKDSDHFKKDDKVNLNKPTEEVFRAKGLIK